MAEAEVFALVELLRDVELACGGFASAKARAVMLARSSVKGRTTTSSRPVCGEELELLFGSGVMRGGQDSGRMARSGVRVEGDDATERACEFARRASVDARR